MADLHRWGVDFAQRFSVLGLLLGLGISACQDDPGATCSPGSFACECFGGSICAEGLTCISNICVDFGDETGDPTGDGDLPGDGDGDGDPTGDGDGDPQGENACDHLIDCVQAAQPESLSAFAAQYGPGGSCFSTPGLTPEDCYTECAAQREILAEVYPSVSECGPPNCGDGKLDTDEVCDGVFQHCLPTCVFQDALHFHECNPVTGLGCDSGHCSLEQDFDSGNDELWFGCRAGSDAPTVENGGMCSSDDECLDPTALCIYRSVACGGYCCTATCYLGPTDEDFGCAAGSTCTPVTNSGGNWSPNSDVFGFCL